MLPAATRFSGACARTAAVAITMREVTNLAYLHGKRARFHAGESVLLGMSLEPQAGAGFIIDVTTLAELTRVTKARSGTTVGAFASLDVLWARVPELAPPGAPASAVRLRLVLLGAIVTLAGGGRTRRAPLEGLVLEPHELPLAIDVESLPQGIGIADRRRATNDGGASYALGVSVAMRVGTVGRFENVRIVFDRDGVLHRATAAEEKLANVRVDPGLFPEVARLAAQTIEPVDAASSAAARAAVPLVTAALREALTQARGTPPPERSKR